MLNLYDIQFKVTKIRILISKYLIKTNKQGNESDQTSDANYPYLAVYYIHIRVSTNTVLHTSCH